MNDNPIRFLFLVSVAWGRRLVKEFGGYPSLNSSGLVKDTSPKG